MSCPVQSASFTVALVGNPNTGKSTLFGALAGVHQHVANYPGATVEKKTGWLRHAGRRFELIDLPGLYSLAPHARDEMVAVEVLLGRRADTPPVDLILCIVDGSNLERNLYLVSQVLEFGLPTVVAVNMLDIAQRQGVQLDLDRLGRRLGVPVVPIQAHRRLGLDALKVALTEAALGDPQERQTPFPSEFEAEVTRLQTLLSEEQPATVGLGKAASETVRSASRNLSAGNLPLSDAETAPLVPRVLARRLLIDSNGYLQRTLYGHQDGRLDDALLAARERLSQVACPVPEVETVARFDWAQRVLDGVVIAPDQYRTTMSDRLDHVLTHRVWGTLVFAVVMFVVFQSVFVWAEPAMGLIDAGTAAAGGWIEGRMAEGALRSLLVDGVVSGVGGVLVFLPQIMILFLFIAVLEDCGYMARAAFLMDRLMSRVGLSGRSFIPMLSSFACSIPGIMAARVIPDERDRLTTILVAPLMTCSARLPVYALLIAAFIPAKRYFGGLVNLQGLTLAGLYLLGIVAAVAVVWVLRRTLLRGRPTSFLLELPSYKWPSPRLIVERIVVRSWLFLRCAGTLILAVSILVWAALYYPRDPQRVEGPYRAQQQRLQTQLDRLPDDAPKRPAVVAELDRIEREIAGEYQRQSLLGQLGRLIEPAVRPLGWDWRIGCAVLASLPAREIVVATTGVIFNVGDEDIESEQGAAQLRTKLRNATWEGTDRKLFNIPVALSIMVFFALCAQCFATLAVMRRETNSWRWPVFAFSYMTALAYVGALVTYQFGMWIGG